MRGTWPHTRRAGFDASDEDLRPYRRLAVRVLTRAFLDLANPALSAPHRESARAFLAGSGMLQHWCRVAALDPSCIVHRAEKLDCGSRRPPRPAGLLMR